MEVTNSLYYIVREFLADRPGNAENARAIVQRYIDRLVGEGWEFVEHVQTPLPRPVWNGSGFEPVVTVWVRMRRPRGT